MLLFLQIAAVDDLIKEKTQEKENLMKQPRRMCGLQPAIKDPEVIGKVSRGSDRLLSGSPLHRGNRENGKKNPVRESTDNLEILPKHREFCMLKL